MASKIKAGDTVWRETLATRDGRMVMVGIRACTIAFRLKGMRTRYELPIGLAYWQAVKLRANELVMERKLRRAEARGKGQGRSR